MCKPNKDKLKHNVSSVRSRTVCILCIILSQNLPQYLEYSTNAVNVCLNERMMIRAMIIFISILKHPGFSKCQ